jgi:hypothetical protein
VCGRQRRHAVADNATCAHVGRRTESGVSILTREPLPIALRSLWCWPWWGHKQIFFTQLQCTRTVQIANFGAKEESLTSGPLVSTMPPLTVLAWIVAAQPLGRVGETPPMGFNPWNELARHYPPWGSGLNESDMLEVAHAMVSEYPVTWCSHHSLAECTCARMLCHAGARTCQHSAAHEVQHAHTCVLCHAGVHATAAPLVRCSACT